jgi:hypothetical protein
MKNSFRRVRPWLLISALFLLISPSSCNKQRAEAPVIDRTFENGIEVIQNHLDPYVLPGEPTDFRLEEEMSIDFGGPEIGELGIADAMSFEVDEKGHVYFFYSHKKGDKIFKFGPDGKFLKSWGPHGQGPGEIMFISSACLTTQGHLIVSDHSSKKITWFSDSGRLEKEVKYPVDGRYFIIYPLSEERFVGYARIVTDRNANYFDFVYYLLNENFVELKKLDVYHSPNPLKKGQRGINHNEFFTVKAMPGGLFIGNEDRGYEILKFDLRGNLVRKIRKEFVPVRVPESVLKKRKDYHAKSGETYYYPEHYLPICDFFADDLGRLHVMTFEKGDKPGEYVYDIFNAAGVLIRRKPLNILSGGDVFALAGAKRDRLYCFQEKGDGFNIFKVYRLIWE